MTGGRGPKRASLYTFSVGTNTGVSDVYDARLGLKIDLTVRDCPAPGSGSKGE